MADITQIEVDLTAALKSRDSMTADTLRGLKSRIKNESIAKSRDLEPDEILALVRSEVKRRKEAVAAYETGGRAELAEKEQKEIAILSIYLPAQPSEEELGAGVDQVIAEHGFTAKDFGAVMGKLKQKFPTADGSILAKLAKEKLK